MKSVAKLTLDLNGNGWFDDDDGVFDFGALGDRPVIGDFDADGDLDCNDIDALSRGAAAGTDNLLFDVTGDGAVDVAEAGRLTVSADPWAHVHVEGVHVLTTPAARAIPLKPGRHYIKYTNPYFEPVEHAVTIEAGQDIHDRATLTQRFTSSKSGACRSCVTLRLARSCVKVAGRS